MNNKILITLIAFFISSSLIYGNLPQSKEANLIEQTSPREVVMEAVGVYNSKKFNKKSDVRKNGFSNASLDAKRAAIHYLLYNGTDPIISNKDEKDRFSEIENDFFDASRIQSFVTYTDPKSKKITLGRGRGLKVVLNLKVNKAAVVSYLEDNAVIFSKDELTEILGYPFIMVIPQSKTDQTPLEVLAADDKAKHAAGVIESYLTNTSYDVVVPSQTSELNALISDVLSVSNSVSDSTYELALSIGSDIYLDYSITFVDGAYSTKQAAITIRAFETTTGRLLGSETGYSKSREGQDYVSIEEATLSALGNVLTRVLNYWEADLSKGTQYKVIAQIDSTSMSNDDILLLQENFFKILEQYSNWTKENIVTTRTMDVLVWADPQDYAKARLLTSALLKDFKQNLKQFDFELINQNRKLIMFTIKK